MEFYNAVIEEAKKNDIELVLNLHHFDMPVELLQKYGGWESKYVVDLFVKFAKTAFECFGDKIKYWTLSMSQWSFQKQDTYMHSIIRT